MEAMLVSDRENEFKRRSQQLVMNACIQQKDKQSFKRQLSPRRSVAKRPRLGKHARQSKARRKVLQAALYGKPGTHQL